MNSLSFSRTVYLFLSLLMIAGVRLRADVNSDLAFSAFSDIDVDALAGGKVLQKSGGLMNFPRGITTQALYIIDAAPADVAFKLTHWSPASHSELKVWLHQSVPAKPAPADFAFLGTAPSNSSVQYQIDTTAKLDPANPALQMSQSEAQLVSSANTGGIDPKSLFVQAWSQILAGRFAHFLGGQAASDKYFTSSGAVEPINEIKSLLHSDPKVYGQYQHLLNQTPAKSSSSAVIKAVPVDLYCEIFDVQGYGAMGAGAVYQMSNGMSIQSADIEFFINSGVYNTIELEQLWPIQVNGKNETLVWRNDLVSAPNVAYLHGTERLASGMIMLQDVKQAVDAFRSEFK